MEILEDKIYGAPYPIFKFISTNLFLAFQAMVAIRLADSAQSYTAFTCAKKVFSNRFQNMLVS